nr:hypothetical secreted protein [uncultured archaeon]
MSIQITVELKSMLVGRSVTPISLTPVHPEPVLHDLSCHPKTALKRFLAVFNTISGVCGSADTKQNISLGLKKSGISLKLWNMPYNINISFMHPASCILHPNSYTNTTTGLLSPLLFWLIVPLVCRS